MAIASACSISSSTFAGQSVFKAQSELSRKVANVEARVSMRRTLKSTPESIWCVVVVRFRRPLCNLFIHSWVELVH